MTRKPLKQVHHGGESLRNNKNIKKPGQMFPGENTPTDVPIEIHTLCTPRTCMLQAFFKLARLGAKQGSFDFRLFSTTTAAH